MSSSQKITGGCQCGAVRYEFKEFGRATICHCRMCQKAFGNFYGALVTGIGLKWKNAEPKYFQSSNKIKRGFCQDCGTPLTYDYGEEVEISIGSLDDPERAPPVLQVSPQSRLSFVDGLAEVPHRVAVENSDEEKFLASIETYQHPDHPTENWSLKKSEEND